MISGKRIAEGKTEIEIPLYPYPARTRWDAGTGFKPADGPRGGVERIAERLRPAAAE
jgi:feruloyl esterase